MICKIIFCTFRFGLQSIQGHNFTYVLIHVDDIILTKNDFEQTKELRNLLGERFKQKDLGNLKYFLGVEFSRWKKWIFMSFNEYDDTILNPSSHLRIVGGLIYMIMTMIFDICGTFTKLVHRQVSNTPSKCCTLGHVICQIARLLLHSLGLCSLLLTEGWVPWGPPLCKK